jgi:hypothetical protein
MPLSSQLFDQSPKDKELVFEFLDSFISNRKIKKELG